MTDHSLAQTNNPAANAKELQFAQPVINIGSHPGNDVTISGDGILPFHAILIVQDNVYRIASLSPEAQLVLEGKPVNEAGAQIAVNQRLNLGNFSLVVRGGNINTGVHITLIQNSDEKGPIVYIMENGEKAILMNLQSQIQEIDVEQNATYEVEVVNAGPIVASFQVNVQGVPPEWVEITPREINLNEGRRATVKITITPPRLPGSTAGKHPLIFITSSPNYPGHTSEILTECVIRPYYEFTLGALTPKNQNIFWKTRSGRVKLPIQNHGNSDANFDVLTIDDENGCSFEYKIKEGVELSRQASVNIPAGADFSLPIEISPIKRPMVAFRSKRYQYNTTVQTAGQGGVTQMVSGSVTSIPLFGWWSIVLTLLAVLIGLFFLLQPRIYNFTVAAGKDIIEQGDTTNLEWSVSPFATNLSISGQDKAIEMGQTHLTINPAQSTIYELMASNWLSAFAGLNQKLRQTVLVVPPSPNIAAFEVDHTSVNKGLPVVIRWSVTKADNVFLTIGDVVTELPKEQFSGEKSVVLNQDTIITLEAKSASGSELRSSFIKVVPPHIDVTKFIVWVRPPTTTMPGTSTSFLGTNHHLASIVPDVAPTPTVTPDTQAGSFPNKYVELVPDKTAESGYRVEFYEPNRQLSKGEQVMVEWQVEGTDTISIAPFTDALPSKGKQPFFPQQSMNFVMTAKNGELQKLFMLPITIFDGTPPVAPTIDFFQGTPTTSTGATDVKFTWSVSGAWTHIQLKTGDTIVADWVKPEDYTTVTVDSSSTYVLVAWNGQLSTAKPLDITINPSLIGTTLVVSNVNPSPAIFKVGDSVSVFVDFAGLPTGKAAPTGTIIVSDGYAICNISLPLKNCTLTFNAAGSKTIKATYSGDSVYLPEDSAGYTNNIIVEANQVKLSPHYYYSVNGVKGSQINNLATPSTPIQVGQGLEVDVTIYKVNKTIPDDNKSQVMVRYCPIDTSSNAVTLTSCISAGPSTATVKTVNGEATGEADLIISSFPTAGTYALLISYNHLDKAFDPILIGSTPSDRILLTVSKGELILIPEGSGTCTYKDCMLYESLSTTVYFDPFLVVSYKLDGSPDQTLPLTTAFITPGSMDITLNPAPTNPWICTWQTTDYKLACPGVAVSSTPAVLTYVMASTDVNYTTKGRPINLTAKKLAVISVNDTFLSNVFVGKPIDLLGSHVFVADQNKPTDPIDPAKYYVNTTGSSPAINTIVKIVNPVANVCDWDSGGNGIIVDQVAATSCQIVFFKGGTYDLSYIYLGDANFDKASSSSKTINIKKQTGVSVNWTYTPTTTPSWTWNIFSDYTLTLAFSCPATTDTSAPCYGFNTMALAATKVKLTAPNCNVYQGTTLKSDGVFTLPSFVSSPYTPTVSDVKVRCTNLSTGTNLGLNFVNPDVTTTASNDFGIASNASQTIIVNPKTVTMDTDLRINNGGTLETYPTSLTIASGAASINHLYLGEEYWAVVTLENMPDDAAIDSNVDFIQMDWPSGLDGSLDSTQTTCTKPSGQDYYKIAFTSKVVSGQTNWVASCKFRFNKIPASNLPSGSLLTYTFNNVSSTSRFIANLKTNNYASISLPATIEKEPVTITTTMINGTSKSTNVYYAKSNPSVQVVLAGTHNQADVKDKLTDSTITVKVGSTALSCTLNSGSSTYVCPLGPMGNTPFASTAVSVSYPETTYFAAKTINPALTLSVVGIPVTATTSSLIFTDASGNKYPFPEIMKCLYCTRTPNPIMNFILGSKTYNITLPINIDPSVTVPGVSSVNEGTLNMTLVSPYTGQSSVITATSISNNMATFSYTVPSSSFRSFSSIKLDYSDSGGPFQTSSQTISETYYMYPQVTFSVGDWTSDGFQVTGMPSGECFRVFFEEANQPDQTCESGYDCWHTNWPLYKSDGTTIKKEKVAANCDSSDYFDGDADDGQVSIDQSTEWKPSSAGSSFQIYLFRYDDTNGNFLNEIGVQKKSWPDNIP